LFALVGLPPDRIHHELTQVFQNGLFQQILLARLATLSPREEARQFEVVGWEQLEAERAAGRPVILGGSHFGVNRVFSLWLARQGVEVMSLAHEDQVRLMGLAKPATLTVVEIGEGFTVDTALLVMRHLRAGGCLQVTGDWPIQKEGLHSYPRTYRGLTRRYPQGMVNFSLMGGAAILPYFCTLRPGGRVRIEIRPPLRPPASPAPAGSAEREAQLEELVHRFAAVLEAEIERSPGSPRWV
jgi:lauroyl/myristoyl acyltransferase